MKEADSSLATFCAHTHPYLHRSVNSTRTDGMIHCAPRGRPTTGQAMVGCPKLPCNFRAHL